VLATNVAETSLTVPGIRYVIDSGTARISRYSYRAKVQRLPIEAISQASANQRKGRCGRVEPGICIRLYSEEDFLARPEFTDPEILRTNLAAVILQMLNLRLGSIEDFPFIEPPDGKAISDGFNLLQELSAVNREGQLTPLGRQLARLPIDPRLGRMVLEAAKLGSLDEILIVASALSVQDPRERPMDRQQAADQAHAQWKDVDSDFAALINLWRGFEEKRQELGSNPLRNWCKKNFLNYLRLREWRDAHRQLVLIARELQLSASQSESRRGSGLGRDAGSQAADRGQGRSHQKRAALPYGKASLPLARLTAAAIRLVGGELGRADAAVAVGVDVGELAGIQVAHLPAFLQARRDAAAARGVEFGLGDGAVAVEVEIGEGGLVHARSHAGTCTTPHAATWPHAAASARAGGGLIGVGGVEFGARQLAVAIAVDLLKAQRTSGAAHGPAGLRGGRAPLAAHGVELGFADAAVAIAVEGLERGGAEILHAGHGRARLRLCLGRQAGRHGGQGDQAKTDGFHRRLLACRDLGTWAAPVGATGPTSLSPHDRRNGGQGL